MKKIVKQVPNNTSPSGRRRRVQYINISAEYKNADRRRAGERIPRCFMLKFARTVHPEIEKKIPTRNEICSRFKNTGTDTMMKMPVDESPSSSLEQISHHVYEKPPEFITPTQQKCLKK